MAMDPKLIQVKISPRLINVLRSKSSPLWPNNRFPRPNANKNRISQLVISYLLKAPRTRVFLADDHEVLQAWIDALANTVITNAIILYFVSFDTILSRLE